jgi:hypothetical protein
MHARLCFPQPDVFFSKSYLTVSGSICAARSSFLHKVPIIQSASTRPYRMSVKWLPFSVLLVLCLRTSSLNKAVVMVEVRLLADGNSAFRRFQHVVF